MESFNQPYSKHGSTQRESAIFRHSVDERPATQGSLHAIIQQHVQQHSAQPDSSSPALRKGSPFQLPNSYSGKTTGIQLNNLDSELAAGIEQYLPTPSIRLRVIKTRLSEEIKNLQGKIARYESMSSALSPNRPNQGINETLLQLKERVRVLEQHEQKVSAELEDMYSHGTLFQQLAQGIHDVQGKLHQGLQQVNDTIPLLLNLGPMRQERLQAAQLQKDLTLYQRVLEEQMKQPTLSTDEISQIVNQSERALRELEEILVALKNHKPQRLQPFRAFFQAAPPNPDK